MAALYLVLCATVLATVLAHTDHPEDAQKACSKFQEPDPCYNHCIQQYLGIIDKDGRYVDSEAAKLLANQSIGKLNETQVEKIAKTCNSLNEQKAAAGCKRADQVSECLINERTKITGVRN